MNFQEVSAAKQEEFLNKLKMIRASSTHNLSKGENAESVLRNYLKSFLPRRYEIGHGQVIDTNKQVSKQLDIIVLNEYQPLFFDINDNGTFFIEGVTAVGEVKTKLSTKSLSESIENSKNFKLLKNMYIDENTNKVSHENLGIELETRIKNRNSKYSQGDFDRFHNRPPYFLFAFESELTIDKITKELIKLGDSLADPYLFIDAVFLLDRGAILNLGDGNERFSATTKSGNRSIGWIKEEDNENVLYNFLNWISTVMPIIKYKHPILPAYNLNVIWE